MANVVALDSHVESLRREQLEMENHSKDERNIERWNPAYTDAGEYKDYSK